VPVLDTSTIENAETAAESPDECELENKREKDWGKSSTQRGKREMRGNACEEKFLSMETVRIGCSDVDTCRGRKKKRK